ncbi:MAG: carbohydrate ABC transporter permease [Spirochaetales bacterium]|nr:carbohydrate ABC transporter permease [Spirochaetales bacterium]
MKMLKKSGYFRKLRRESLRSTIVVYTFLLLITLLMILPFLHELAKSFSYPTEVEAGRVSLLPKRFTFGNYYYFWRKQSEQLGRAFLNTIYITVVGTAWTVFNTALLAFPLSRSKKEFRLGVPILMIVIFCFVFQRPVIPYFLTVKAYGLMDTRAALILSHTIVPFYLLLVLTFFRGLPEDLFDACRIDGGSDFHLFWHVALPLSKASLASVAIFSGVTMWNLFFHPMLFIRSSDLMPLQPIVRSIMRGTGDVLKGNLLDNDPFRETESIKSALIMLTIIPVAVVYPFLQKYFTKGTMVGAIKS